MTKSAVCCCRNRNIMLQRSLPTWLTQNVPFTEIVLVDWGGEQKVRNLIVKDPRIILVEVPDEEQWVLSHAYNLGMTIASGRVFYKLDTDYLLANNFTELYGIHQKNSRHFWTGNWRNYPLNDNRCNINGCVVLEAKAFRKVGGYNERIIEYGYDDEDLYTRLQHAGYTRKNMQYGPIRHIKHDNVMRACGPGKQHRSALIVANRKMAEADPWGPYDDSISWKVFKRNSRHYVCRREGA